MGREEMRAGDDDREAVAARLKEALDQGRLDLHEYDERLQRVYGAKTYGELETVTTDLPGTVPPRQARVATPQPATAVGKRPPYLTGYAGVVVVCVIIWLLSSLGSGHWQYPWPAWMLIPLVWSFVGRSRGHGR
ncbi:DUF1707 SHOCT-like domain-containing protein [Symbioplanes lichenis]|uniref:DUF1707 SHOCT-like domain-containing protein n=1 Tax=Symbioplanes lichenis TaxID=1629072 RepID=UPI002738E0E7|nr:DUF1707 domain-containing protein [Actinoplanes lichenis]